MGGECAVWEKPIEGASYIVSCDPSQGRVTSEKSDTCAIGVWMRLPGSHIKQVAEVVFRWSAGRQGECIAALSRRWGSYLDHTGRERNCAVINIERNLCDVQLHTILESQLFPDEYLFIPRADRDLLAATGQKRFFTAKTTTNQDYLLNNMIDYLDRGALEIRSEATLNELRTLYKDRNGKVDTNGKDRAIMVAMACVADRELPPVDRASVAEEKKPVVLEPGRCPVDPAPVKKNRVPHRVKWEPWTGAMG